MPPELAALLADTLKAVYQPALAGDPNGMAACCPTIISTLKELVPLETNGYADKDDIRGAYFHLYQYVKFTTTDHYKIRRPTAPSRGGDSVVSFASWFGRQ